jgi:hypothetical protein
LKAHSPRLPETAARPIPVIQAEKIASAVKRGEPFVIRDHPKVRALAKELAPEPLAEVLEGTMIEVEHKLRWVRSMRTVEASAYLRQASQADHYWRQFLLSSVGLKPALPRAGRSGCMYFDYGWIGPPGTVQTFHQDNHDDIIVNHNLYAQVTGRKYVAVAAPSDSAFFRSMPLTERENRHSRAMPWDACTQAACSTLHDAVLGPGDLLYIPPRYWHFLQSCSTSVSVSRWWFSSRIAELIYAYSEGIDVKPPKQKPSAAQWHTDLAAFGGLSALNRFVCEKPLMLRLAIVIQLSRFYGEGVLNHAQEAGCAELSAY